MIKQIMIALVLIVGLSGVGGADFHIPPENEYNESSHGFGTYSASDCYTTSGSARGLSFRISIGEINTIQVYYSGVITECNATCSTLHVENACFNRYTKAYLSGQKGDAISGNFTTGRHPYYYNYIRAANYYSYGCGYYSKQSWSLTISETLIDRYKISGNRACSGVDLYHKDSLGTYTLINYTDYTTESTPYEFINLLNGSDYRLSFVGHNYDFTCTGDEIYNYDACSHTQYRFEESCGNLIPDSEGYYCEYTGDIISCNWFEESDGILDISNSSATKIEIYTNTFIGQIGWLIDPVVSDTTYTLENPNIAWGLKVIVQNESDGTLIDGAMVKVDQDCYCTPGYSTRQKLTVNGMASFGDMSLQDASLWVMKTGYKILDENSTSYSAFLSGRSNFSSKTWIVKLAPNDAANESEWYEPSNKVDIHFRDVNGNRTSQILDTDTEVYLYYENNNTEEEAMTLKFQSSTHIGL
jgi:hypothetical protein